MMNAYLKIEPKISIAKSWHDCGRTTTFDSRHFRWLESFPLITPAFFRVGPSGVQIRQFAINGFRQWCFSKNRRRKALQTSAMMMLHIYFNCNNTHSIPLWSVIKAVVKPLASLKSSDQPSVACKCKQMQQPTAAAAVAVMVLAS